VRGATGRPAVAALEDDVVLVPTVAEPVPAGGLVGPVLAQDGDGPSVERDAATARRARRRADELTVRRCYVVSPSATPVIR